MDTLPAAVPADPPQARHVPQLRTLLLTDLVDSTALVERLGDQVAAGLFRAHDRLVLELQQRWRGRLIDRSDGMLLLFERPIDGLGFALDYTRGLRELGGLHKVRLQARSGLHVGEVLSWRNSDEAVRVGAKPVEVEGLAKPMAGRLMMMARPGQILLSAVAEPLAHRAARELGERGQHLLWKSHGRWRLKGVPDAQQVFEVGEPGFAPLRMPPNTLKAWRAIPLWRRPAALAAEVVAVVAIAVGLWFISRPQPAIAFHERDWVVLADLRNLTGQPVLDDALEQAFRISLEQSRHVNVLSDLKTRDTLARMQRKPDSLLDRTVASEIALRDGARAVILPTVAEVGGRLRVSAEVIDPNTQTTVYAEYADGRGTESALASVDQVTGALRSRLGEAMESVERNSAPLPQVTTSNLEALRAYSLGTQAYAQRRSGEALDYFKQAISLDSGFALAHLAVARVYVSNADRVTAHRHLVQARASTARLTPRDRLYLEAWSAELGPRPAAEAPAKWKLLAGMYPDFYAGHYQYAWHAFLGNRWDEAATHAAVATAPQEPLRSVSHELLGRVQLAQGRSEAALGQFVQAEQLGGYGPNRRRAAALASMERFAEAEAVLASMPRQSLATGNLTNQFEYIAIPVDRGLWERAATVAGHAAATAATTTPLMAQEFSLVQSTVALLQGRKQGGDVLEGLAHKSLTLADDVNSQERQQQVYFALGAAYVSQRQGDSALAAEVVRRAAPLVADIAEPMARQLLQVVEAGQSRLGGNPAAAIERLRPLINGRELFQVRVALRDALVAAGRDEESLEHSRWIAAHRGQAYIEGAGDQALQALNVADTRLARLEAAEALSRLGRARDAGQELERFLAAWPRATLPAYLERRVESVRSASK